jgi:lipoprotein-anchoring transpeptidase ErfK/SrfK
MLKIDKRMSYGDFIWNDAGIPPGPIAIRVDLRTQLLSVFRGGHEIGTAVILYGADAKETPTGRFPILWKGKDHRSSLYDAPMPFTLRLTGDGVAIHGSDVRWGAATHGCIGVPTDFARLLYGQTKVGDPVAIVRSKGAHAAA